MLTQFHVAFLRVEGTQTPTMSCFGRTEDLAPARQWDSSLKWVRAMHVCQQCYSKITATGPCLIKDANSTSYNPHAWNENANIFFVDQPVGTGFSYADHGEAVVRLYKHQMRLSAHRHHFRHLPRTQLWTLLRCSLSFLSNIQHSKDDPCT